MDPSGDFPAESAEGSTPATHGQFSAPFHAQEPGHDEGFTAPPPFVPDTPSEHPRARVAETDEAPTDEMPLLSAW